MDIEGAFRRNVDGAWAKLRYWSVVNRDVAKCGGGKKFWRIKYTELIIVIGDPEDSRLIASSIWCGSNLSRVMWISARSTVDQSTAATSAGVRSQAGRAEKQRPAASVSASSKRAFPSERDTLFVAANARKRIFIHLALITARAMDPYLWLRFAHLVGLMLMSAGPSLKTI
jgi:hypothetical protein